MLNFGLIGCGNISAIHVEGLFLAKGARLVAACDSDEAKGEKFAENHHVIYYKNYEEMLAQNNIDAVIIATPHYLHHEMSLAALKAGKHVLCEKPMALTVRDGREIIRQAKKSQVEYAVCYQNRFNDATLRLKELLKQDIFGMLRGIKCEVTWNRDTKYYQTADWKGTWEFEGGGVLINQGIHTLDLITWLIATPTKIKGKIMTSLLENVIDVEDSAMAIALIGKELPVVIHASNNYSSDPAPIITFDYEKETIILSGNDLFIGDKHYWAEEAFLTEGQPSYWGNGHQHLIQTFINKINNIDDECIDCLASDDALESLRMVCAIYESDQSDAWVKLK